jgi:hypothetical protein
MVRLGPEDAAALLNAPHELHRQADARVYLCLSRWDQVPCDACENGSSALRLTQKSNQGKCASKACLSANVSPGSAEMRPDKQSAALNSGHCGRPMRCSRAENLESARRLSNCGSTLSQISR